MRSRALRTDRSARFPPVRLAGCNSGIGTHDRFLVVFAMIKPCPKCLASPPPTIEQVSLTKTIYKTVKFFAPGTPNSPDFPEVVARSAGRNDGGKELIKHGAKILCSRATHRADFVRSASLPGQQNSG